MTFYPKACFEMLNLIAIIAETKTIASDVKLSVVKAEPLETRMKIVMRHKRIFSEHPSFYFN